MATRSYYKTSHSRHGGHTSLNITDPIQFNTAEESHTHALKTLNALLQYDDFMLSIGNVLDVGCGPGLDLEWWASRTTRDTEMPELLNIKCTGIDLFPSLVLPDYYTPQEKITYSKFNMEDDWIMDHMTYKDLDKQYDVVWCHDVFQYAINPLKTLQNFYNLLSPGGMLALMIPQTTNVIYHRQEFNQVDGTFYNHTLVSLIHMLAISRFDCKAGFFRKAPDDPWISAIVYKPEEEMDVLDPRTTRWYDLVDLGLLPNSADAGIQKAGHLRQRDLVLPWLNKSLTDYAQQ